MANETEAGCGSDERERTASKFMARLGNAPHADAGDWVVGASSEAVRRSFLGSKHRPSAVSGPGMMLTRGSSLDNSEA